MCPPPPSKITQVMWKSSPQPWGLWRSRTSTGKARGGPDRHTEGTPVPKGCNEPPGPAVLPPSSLARGCCSLSPPPPAVLASLIHTTLPLDKLPFKGVCLILYLPLVRSRSSCRQGWWGRWGGWGGRGRSLLSYELFLTHVYNFHKSFCNTEREEGRGRQIQFTPAKPPARWAGKGGERKRQRRGE